MQEDKAIHDALRRSELILKYIDKNISESEYRELMQWVNADPQHRELFDSLVRDSQKEDRKGAWRKRNKEKAWNNIVLRKEEKHPLRKTHVRFAAAAVAAIMLMGGIFYYVSQPQNEYTVGLQKPAEVSSDIMPGSNKAVLTLSDGRQVLLDSVGQGVLTTDGGSEIIKSEDGNIVYARKENTVAATSYNSISIPRGGMYKVVLADGTKVWLSSETSLKYPVEFSHKERRVQLSGEAYFEVAKDVHKPFIVEAQGAEIKVLGTQFNVNAYSSHSFVKTTLVEGAVEFRYDREAVRLKPGQAAFASEGQGISNVSYADVERDIDWKNGFFIFRDEELESIMTRISRWYDIEVQYEDEALKKQVFGGKFSKNSTLSELLKSMELTGTIKFKRQERRVTVMR